MTKDDIINQIANNTGNHKKVVSPIIENFFASVKDSMIEGNNIYIRGFGSFVNIKKARKKARNISKNTSVIIEEHYAPKFKPANPFADQIKKSVHDNTLKKKKSTPLNKQGL